MTRNPKTSHKSSDRFSSNHHFNAEDSQSPYESYEEEEDDEEDASVSNINSTSNSPIFNDQLSSNVTKTPSSNPPPHSYINVAPLPIFHGNPDECPVSHLSRFLKVCRANNASSTDSMLRIFPVTLESEASIWYDLNIEPYPSLSWDEIKASFIEAYGKTEATEELRTELMMLNQKNEEPVRSYFLRMQLILKKLGDHHGFTDNVLKGIFVSGLMEGLKECVISEKADSLNNALSLAFGFEKMKRVNKGVKIMKDVKCGFCGGFHEETLCKIKERIRELFSKKKKKEINVNEKEKENENGEEEEEDKRRPCQCSKHQCWNKKLERNVSTLSRNSTKDQ